MQQVEFKVSYTDGPSFKLNRGEPETLAEMSDFVGSGEADVLALADAQFVVYLQNFVRTRMKESSLTGGELESAAQSWADAYRYSQGRRGEKVVDLGGLKVSDAIRAKLEAAGVKCL